MDEFIPVHFDRWVIRISRHGIEYLMTTYAELPPEDRRRIYDSQIAIIRQLLADVKGDVLPPRIGSQVVPLLASTIAIQEMAVVGTIH